MATCINTYRIPVTRNALTLAIYEVIFVTELVFSTPNIVNLKTRLGDWEADTVIGKGHKGVLVTLAERCSRLTLIACKQAKKADVVCVAIIKIAQTLPS